MCLLAVTLFHVAHYPVNLVAHYKVDFSLIIWTSGFSQLSITVYAMLFSPVCRSVADGTIDCFPNLLTIQNECPTVSHSHYSDNYYVVNNYML
jgi:hypothetical protein